MCLFVALDPDLTQPQLIIGTATTAATPLSTLRRVTGRLFSFIVFRILATDYADYFSVMGSAMYDACWPERNIFCVAG
jgi:hypothetical protein